MVRQKVLTTVKKEAPKVPISDRHITKAEFARKLIGLMDEKRWYNSELARRADVGRAEVGKYVKGLTFPTAANLAAISQALGVDPYELLPNLSGELDRLTGKSEHFSRSIKPKGPTTGRACEMQVIADRPGHALLKVDCIVPTSIALKVVALLDEANVGAPDRG